MRKAVVFSTLMNSRNIAQVILFEINVGINWLHGRRIVSNDGTKETVVQFHIIESSSASEFASKLTESAKKRDWIPLGAPQIVFDGAGLKFFQIYSQEVNARLLPHEQHDLSKLEIKHKSERGT